MKRVYPHLDHYLRIVGYEAPIVRWCHTAFAALFFDLLEKELQISEARINDHIRAKEVRLVGPKGEQVGVVSIQKALQLAEDSGLDLVEVAPNSHPPVAKLMDYGKFKYEAAQKAREARRNQTNAQLKEIRFRLKIDSHDYETKKGHVIRFLKAGDKVKVMIMFRGREQSRPEMGYNLLMKLADELTEYATIEFKPKQDGRNMTMVLAPNKTKAEVRAEAERAKKAEADAAATTTTAETPDPAAAEQPAAKPE